MAWTASLDVSVGDATKETDYDQLVANAEYLQTLANAEHDFHVGTGDGGHKSMTFPTGASLNFNSGNIVLTHSSNTLTLTGGASGTLIVGVDDAGHDVKLFGNAAGAYMEWDASADQLRIMGASADAATSTGKLLLATSLTNINANDVLGKIDFQAPHEAGGTDAIAIAASIQAVAQGTFAANVNATDLIFYTGHAEPATEKFRMTSQGEIGIGGANYGTDGHVLTSAGAGAAVAWEALPSGATSWDAIVAASGADYTTPQLADDALDAGDYTMYCKGETYVALTVSTNNARIFLEPGTVFTGAITLSGSNVTLVAGAGCDFQGLVTLSGIGNNLLCENGCTFIGVATAAADCTFDGGGHDTVVSGGVARHAVELHGAFNTARNFTCSTTAGGGQAFNALHMRFNSDNSLSENIVVTDSDNEGIHNEADDSMVTNCQVLGADSHGINATNHRQRTIGNFVDAAGAQGIYSNGNDTTITSNIVRDQASAAIYLDTGANDQVIFGNRLDGAITDNGTSNLESGFNDEGAF